MQLTGIMFLFGVNAIIVYFIVHCRHPFGLVPVHYESGHICSGADTSGVRLRQSWQRSCLNIYLLQKHSTSFSINYSIFFLFFTAGWDRTVSFCWWISILGCLPHKYDGRWYVGWSRDSTRRGKLFSNVHPRDQQSSASPWRNDLPRVWCYW